MGQYDNRDPKCGVKCRKCGEVLESMYRHDFHYCGCGSTFVDGGEAYLRCGGDVLPAVINLETGEEVD